MNDNQFDALLAVLRDVAQELMFLRDEVSGLRDIYGQAHGFESDLERSERIEKALRDGTIFNDPNDENIGGFA